MVQKFRDPDLGSQLRPPGVARAVAVVVLAAAAAAVAHDEARHVAHGPAAHVAPGGHISVEYDLVKKLQRVF